jgi:hypothetical protein
MFNNKKWGLNTRNDQTGHELETTDVADPVVADVADPI